MIVYMRVSTAPRRVLTQKLCLYAPVFPNKILDHDHRGTQSPPTTVSLEICAPVPNPKLARHAFGRPGRIWTLLATLRALLAALGALLGRFLGRLGSA